MLLKTATAIALALLAAGCPSTQPPCAYSGSRTAAMTGELVQVLSRDIDNGPAPTLYGATIPDGGPLVLSAAPQGGYVFFAGAFLQNLDTCKVTLSGELVDPSTGNALTNLDQRQGNFVEDTGDGFTEPTDLYSDLPNIPACPGALGQGIVGVPAILKITVTDETGKSGVFEQAVVPTCNVGDTNCPCVCGPSDGGGC